MKYNYNNDIYSTVVFYILIFLMSPIIAVVLYLLNIWQQEESNKIQNYGLFVLLASWLAGMNATKIPASDQIAYEKMFLNVPNFTFWEAMTKLNVDISNNTSETYLEPIYKVFCYIGYYLTFGNQYLYFALVTFVIYMTMFYCIQRVMRYAGCGSKTIITSIIICAFFFQFFNETVHAIRQFLAGCIVLLAIVKKNETNKNPWILYLLALLSHKSTLLFVLFCLIPIQFVEKKKYVLLTIVTVALCTFFMSQLSTTLMLLNFGDSYILKRVSLESKEFSQMNKLILYGVSVPIIYICLRALLTDREDTKKMKYFLFISLLLCIFVVSCGKNTLFQGRYFFYLYFIVPFVIPLLFEQNKLIKNSYQLILCLFMPLYFFFSFNTCIWQYADTLKLLFYPYPLLLNHF